MGNDARARIATHPVPVVRPRGKSVWRGGGGVSGGGCRLAGEWSSSADHDSGAPASLALSFTRQGGALRIKWVFKRDLARVTSDERQHVPGKRCLNTERGRAWGFLKGIEVRTSEMER